MSLFILLGLVLLFVLPLVCFLYLGQTSATKKKKNPSPQVWGFFHPYCSGGGGGERVLWKMIQVLQQQQQPPNNDNGNSSPDPSSSSSSSNPPPNLKTVIIFTIDPPDTDEAQLRHDAEQRFDVTIPYPVQLVSLQQYKQYLEPAPFLSLVLESWGTMKLAYQALRLYNQQQKQPRQDQATSAATSLPSLDVFCDTTGCAFTFLVSKWFQPTCWIVAYVHYPTISTDMMQWEWNQRSRSVLKRYMKLVYYKLFAMLYGLVGSLADLVMVNSTWTYNHIHSLWWFSKHIHIVYPPCRVVVPRTTTSTTEAAATSSMDNNQQTQRNPGTIVSIGQFRPEKDHKLQIEAVACYLNKYVRKNNNNKEEEEEEDDDKNMKKTANTIQLLLIGSCRNDQDHGRVQELRHLVKEKNLEDVVTFNINPPYAELQSAMEHASMGIHTMRQEHFGIGIVEMMAAGLITIAHNSGGPQTDIIVEPGVTGFLATTAEEYATVIHTITNMDSIVLQEMRQKAQQSAVRFSDTVFDQSLIQSLSLFKNISK